MSNEGEAGSGTTNPIALPTAEQLVGKIEELQAQLQQQSPGYEGLLHSIHVALSKDPDMVHLLSEQQIGIICAGLQKKKNIVIATVATKGTGGRKALGKITMEDL